MDFVLWKTILLEWSKKTGFFNEPYNEIRDTDIDIFFAGFKENITTVDGYNVYEFMKVEYPWIKIKICETADVNASGIPNQHNIHKDDYVYIYSMLLHYGCVRSANTEMQKICNTLSSKFQRIVAKFLSTLLTEKNFTLPFIQGAIEDAERSAEDEYNSSPLIKNGTHATVSQLTPKTHLLDKFYRAERKLSVSLETERMERQFQAIELNNLKDRNMFLEKELCASQNLVRRLRNQIESTDDNTTQSHIQPAKRPKYHLQSELEDLEKLNDSYMVNGSLSDKVTSCEMQIEFLKNEIKSLIERNIGLEEQLGLLQVEIGDCNKRNVELQDNNSELDEIIHDLRSQLNKTGPDSLFNLSGSLSNIFPENMADAVVDIRLAELQKQNQCLIMELECIGREFAEAKNQLRASIEERDKMSADFVSTTATMQPERETILTAMRDQVAKENPVVSLNNIEMVKDIDRFETKINVFEEHALSLRIIEKLTILRTEYEDLLTESQSYKAEIEAPLLDNSLSFSACEGNIAATTEAKAHIQTNLEFAVENLSDIKEKHHLLQLDNEKLLCDLSQVRNDCDQYAMELVEYADKLQQLTEAQKQQVSNSAKLSNELESSEIKCADLSSKVQLLENEMEMQKCANLSLSKDKAILTEKLELEIYTNKLRLEEILQFRQNIVHIQDDVGQQKNLLEQILEKELSELSATEKKYSDLNENVTKLRDELSFLLKSTRQQNKEPNFKQEQETQDRMITPHLVEIKEILTSILKEHNKLEALVNNQQRIAVQSELQQSQSQKIERILSENRNLESIVLSLKGQFDTLLQLLNQQNCQKSALLQIENDSLKCELQQIKRELKQNREEVERTKNELIEKDVMPVRSKSDANFDVISSLGFEQEISMLRTKLSKTRKQLEEEKKNAEEVRKKWSIVDKLIRENRQEFETKFEKMKAKMKKLYNKEMIADRAKYEKAYAALESKLQKSHVYIKELSAKD